MISNLDTHSLVAAATDRRMVKFFKALSDSTRQNILRLLDDKERTVSEIVSNFNLSQPTISRHLAVLKEAELVMDRRQGQNVFYSLNDDVLTDTMEEFLGRFDSAEKPID